MRWKTLKRFFFLIFAAGVMVLFLDESFPFRTELAGGLMILYIGVFWFDNYQLSLFEPESPRLCIRFSWPYFDTWLLLLLLLLVLNAFLIDHDFPVFTVVSTGLLIATAGDIILQKRWMTHRLFITDDQLIVVSRGINRVHLEEIVELRHHRDRLVVRTHDKDLPLFYHFFSAHQLKEFEAHLDAISGRFKFKVPEGFRIYADKKLKKSEYRNDPEKI